MQKRHKIERCSKDEIRFLCDAADSERECGVAQLVAVARETAFPHVLRDFHETGPRNCRQTIRADDEHFGCRVVIGNNPDNCVVP